MMGCISCAAGKYSAVGASLCTDCAAGKFLGSEAKTSATDCGNCVAGKYSSAGAAVCTDCAAGKFFGSPEQTSDVCTNCAAGKYSTTTGASVVSTCLDCAAGKYQPSAGVKSVSVRGRKRGKGVWETKGARSREVKKECNIQRCKHTCIYIHALHDIFTHGVVAS
jgi:hypothetical protein